MRIFDDAPGSFIPGVGGQWLIERLKRASDPAKRIDLAVGPLPRMIRYGDKRGKIATANQQLCSGLANATAFKKAITQELLDPSTNKVPGLFLENIRINFDAWVGSAKAPAE